MTNEELNEVLKKHKLWRNRKEGGRKACLFRADLRGVRLSDADLRGADLRDANLRDANLQDADLSDAELSGANLSYVDLCGADVDFAAWPMSCGSLSVNIDSRLAAQLVYHAVRAAQSACDDEGVRAFCNAPEVIALANRFHRVEECGEVKPVGEKVKHE